MFSFLILAATPLAAVPTPVPLALPTNFQFNSVSAGSQHPVLLLIVQALFIAAAAALVILMSMQTTKNEGLSGSIGGRSESAYRGRLGLDQQLTRLTGGVAVAFVFLAITYFLVTR